MGMVTLFWNEVAVTLAPHCQCTKCHWISHNKWLILCYVTYTSFTEKINKWSLNSLHFGQEAIIDSLWNAFLMLKTTSLSLKRPCILCCFTCVFLSTPDKLQICSRIPYLCLPEFYLVLFTCWKLNMLPNLR